MLIIFSIIKKKLTEADMTVRKKIAVAEFVCNRGWAILTRFLDAYLLDFNYRFFGRQEDDVFLR